MWARVIEFMTAVWLACSPYIFRTEDASLVWGDTLIAIAIIIFSSLSFWRKTRYAYLINLGVAIGLIAWGRLQGTPPSPANQNHIVVGLFLLMIAIIPNEAARPPEPWRKPLQECD